MFGPWTKTVNLGCYRAGVLFVLLCWAASTGAQVFVSPTGDDANPGTAEKPVARVQRAIELARSWPVGQTRRVVLLAGVYFDASIRLTQPDSNLIIESAKGDPATLVGGVPLSHWEKQRERFWSAVLPAGRVWDIRMLQVNGRFCSRARYPETGTLTYLSSFNVPYTMGGGWKRKPTNEELTILKYKPADIPPGLDITNAEVTVFHKWNESVAGIRSRDTNTDTFILTSPLAYPLGAFDVRAYCFWNVKEGMTQPGQWYYDRTHGRIIYWPLPTEEMDKALVVVPSQRVIISLVGATNVTLHNFNLAVTTVPLVTGGCEARAFDGAIQLDKTDDITISNLHITNIAGHAIKAMAMKSQNSIRVMNCDIALCGAGGIYLSGSNNLITNNLIHDVGLMFPSAIGICCDGQNSTLSHNEIHDTPYGAIDFLGDHLVIEHNLIYRCMKLLHDGAAIYGSVSHHTTIRYNVARDIIDNGGNSAYYLDEQCADCLVEHNIALNVDRPSNNHMATNNTIRANVFINQGNLLLTFPRCQGYSLQGNVLYATGTITFLGINNVATWSNNVAYAGARKVDGVVLERYVPTGHVPGITGDTLPVDPLFIDLSKWDLNYKPESPALKLHLQPLSMSQGGRL